MNARVAQDFVCPTCGSRYVRLQVRPVPRVNDAFNLACLVCAAPLETSKGDDTVLKYFLLDRGRPRDVLWPATPQAVD